MAKKRHDVRAFACTRHKSIFDAYDSLARVLEKAKIWYNLFVYGVLLRFDFFMFPGVRTQTCALSRKMDTAAGHWG